MGLIRKFRNRLFQNLEFCIHDATLGADLASCGCRMDMVDGALERVDVACFNPNIEIVSWCLFLLENSFEFQEFWKISGFWNFFLVGCFGSTRRTITKVRAFESPDVIKHCKHLKHVPWTSQKILQASEVEKLRKIQVRFKFKLRNFYQYFYVKNFFFNFPSYYQIEISYDDKRWCVRKLQSSKQNKWWPQSCRGDGWTFQFWAWEWS